MALRGFEEQEVDSVFATESAFFDSHRAEWLLRHKGQFALVKGQTLYGFYETLIEAWRDGVGKIGYTEMLIKEVRETDRVYSIPTIG